MKKESSIDDAIKVISVSSKTPGSKVSQRIVQHASKTFLKTQFMRKFGNVGEEGGEKTSNPLVKNEARQNRPPPKDFD